MGKKKKRSFYHKLKKSSSGCFLFLYILFLKCIFRDSGRATCDIVTGHCGCKDAFSEPVSSHPARRGQKRRGSLVRLVHSAWHGPAAGVQRVALRHVRQLRALQWSFRCRSLSAITPSLTMAFQNSLLKSIWGARAVSSGKLDFQL